MPSIVKGIVARAKGEPVEIVDIVVPDPGPGEVVVDVKSCGVCQTDDHYRNGEVGEEYPYLLGHESAGVVSAVGEGVDTVAVGDFVILNWRAVCGICRACRRAEPWYCFATKNATQKMTLRDGTELRAALGIGSFIEKTLVAAGQCTKVPESDPAVVGLLGCGVMAGIGAALNTGGVGRGTSVAVIGCGGVGSAAIAGSAYAGASNVIAIDIDDRKLATALRLGADHAINSVGLSTEEVATRVQELTNGFGADVVIDAVGSAQTYEQAFYARDLAGTVVLVGVPNPAARLEMPLQDFFSRGGSLKSAWYGDCLPERDFPVLVDAYLKGRLPLQEFVTERISLDDVEAAFTKMKDGAVLRSVVEFS